MLIIVTTIPTIPTNTPNTFYGSFVIFPICITSADTGSSHSVAYGERRTAYPFWQCPIICYIGLARVSMRKIHKLCYEREDVYADELDEKKPTPQ